MWIRTSFGASASRGAGRRPEPQPRKRGHSHPAILNSAATTASPVAPRTSEEAFRKRRPLDDSESTLATCPSGCPDFLDHRNAIPIPHEYSHWIGRASRNSDLFVSTIYVQGYPPVFTLEAQFIHRGVDKICGGPMADDRRSELALGYKRSRPALAPCAQRLDTCSPRFGAPRESAGSRSSCLGCSPC